MSNLTFATKVISLMNCLYLFIVGIYLIKLRIAPPPGMIGGLQCTPFRFLFLYFVLMDAVIATLITQGHMKPNKKWRKWLAFLFCADLIIFGCWLLYAWLYNAGYTFVWVDPGGPNISFFSAKLGSLSVMLAINLFILIYVIWLAEEEND